MHHLPIKTSFRSRSDSMNPLYDLCDEIRIRTEVNIGNITYLRDEMFAVALIYLHRLQWRTNRRIQVNWMTVHRLIATAILVAHKNLDMEWQGTNQNFANAFGIQLFGLTL